MANRYDGSIRINTQIDSSGVKKGITSIGNSLKGLIKLAGVAFSVRAIQQFTKEATEAYKVQMQNEVKLETIMRQRMGATKESIEDIKKYASAQQQLGVIGDEVQLSGAQQLSTFLKEEESLKALIPAMNNLIAQQKGYNATAEDATNIGNLFGKAMMGQTSALKRVGITFSDAEANVMKYGTELEKAQMLSQIITNNVGNMNQVLANTPYGRQVQLANAIGDIKEVVGQAVTNIKTMFLPALNAMASVASSCANAFLKLTEVIAGFFGVDISTSLDGVEETAIGSAEGIEDMADALDDASKSAKKANSQLQSFNELNVISSDKSSSSGSSGSSGGASVGSVVDSNSAQQTSANINVMTEKLKELKQFVDEIGQSIKDGFMKGFNAGDATQSLESIKTSFTEIKESFKSIFSDGTVAESFKGMVLTFISSAATQVGSFVSIGLSFASGILGGVSQFFQENAGMIKEKLISIFDIQSSIGEIQSNLSVALAEIYSVFGGENFQGIISNFLGIITTAFLSVLELASKYSRDIWNMITTPIVNNSASIKEMLDGILGFINQVLGSIKGTVSHTFAEINKLYDEHLKPFYDSIASGLSEIVGAFTSFWNQNIKPLLDKIAKDFDKLMKSKINPLISNVIGLIGDIIDVLKELWVTYLQPMIVWIVDNVLPKLTPILEGLWEIFDNTIGGFVDVLNGFVDTFRGAVKFFKGLATGDWKTAFEGLQEVFEGVWNSVKALWDITGGNIQIALETLLQFIDDEWEETIKPMGDTIEEVFSGIWDNVKTYVNYVLGGIEKMANGIVDGINVVIRAMNKLKFDIPDWVPGGMGGKSFGFNLSELSKVTIPRLATGGITTGSTLANIGEAGREAVLPLENNLGYLDKFAETIASKINGDGNVRVYLDGKEIFANTRKYASQYRKTTGNPAF